MSLSDYFKGPAHRQRAEQLEQQLTKLQGELDQVKALAHKFGAMDALQIQHEIERENQRLQTLGTWAPQALHSVLMVSLLFNGHGL